MYPSALLIITPPSSSSIHLPVYGQSYGFKMAATVEDNGDEHDGPADDRELDEAAAVVGRPAASASGSGLMYGGEDCKERGMSLLTDSRGALGMVMDGCKTSMSVVKR